MVQSFRGGFPRNQFDSWKFNGLWEDSNLNAPGLKALMKEVSILSWPHAPLAVRIVQIVFGPVAQLGERLNGIEEAAGAEPARSIYLSHR